MSSLPLYQCHKRVRAAKISAIDQGTAPNNVGGTWLLSLEGAGSVEVPHEWLKKHNPEAGGYFVHYDDGYTSFSPAKAFEEGYAQVREG